MSAPDHQPDQPGADTRIGMAIMATAMLMLPVGDTLSKMLTTVLHPVEVAMWRFIAQGCVMLPAALVMRDRLRGAMFSPVLALSGALVTAVLVCLVSAFAVMPVATAIAIFFVEPLLLTLLAWPLLGERPGPRRLIAVAVGLGGALLILRPNLAAFGMAALLPLGAALGYALNMILVRRSGRTRSALTMQCGTTLYGVVLLIGAVLAARLAGWTAPPAGGIPTWVYPTVAGAGLLSAVTFLMIAEAFRRVEAGLLAPFQYLEILGATVMGWLVFGDLPDLMTWAGVAIILASGLYVFHRERAREVRLPRRRRALR